MIWLLLTLFATVLRSQAAYIRIAIRFELQEYLKQHFNVKFGFLLVLGCLQTQQPNRLQPTVYVCLRKIKSESTVRIWNVLQWYRQCA